ncbi:S8 family serine peptidase [Shewanella putrefaciens]|uniref:S8 family serine peptidase n=1 Tax=Shewanella putrefaciens TaxID=24 RepID=UPI0018E706A1|nr:S8 family serine peptidase [Shewanella putrefaciens]
MNLKTVSLAILSALYGATVAAAAQSGSPVLLKQLNPLPANPQQQVQQQQKAATQGINAGARQGVSPGGRNMQIAPASARQKFIAEPERTGEEVYIVRLRDLPVAAYDGRVKGFAATAKSVVKRELELKSGADKAAIGNRSRTNAVSIEAVETLANERIDSYKSYLTQKQETVLQAASGLGINAKTTARFTTAVNGFSMKMTQEQAKKLASLPSVEFVERSTMQKILTDRGPTFIGADQVWSGNTVATVPQKGEGVVVGIIDTGINTDHIAFADVGGDGYDHSNPLGEGVYLGDCATDKLVCNDKLIGVYTWPVITDAYGGKAPATGEDYQGHGSHVAGTAAGNYVENVPLLSPSLGDGDGDSMGFTFGSTSGVAPHANIISYQVCLPEEGCPTEAVLSAYEQAIEDGVDIINFSIGGAERFPWEDATELAMLAAREAGILVAAAAGNSGGDQYNTYFGSLGHSAPWSMVVAASTHDRVLNVTKNLLSLSGGNYAPYIYIEPEAQWPDDIAGFSTGSIVDGNAVVAVDFGDEKCENAFAPGTFTSDQIVICKRGVNARVAKAHNVLAGGAGGFILYNEEWYPEITDAEMQLFDDTYPLPSIHVSNNTGQNIINWLNDGGADHKITITGGSIARTIDPAAGDILAKFSSLGPSSTYKHHLAPNISAPGVNIYAPYADEHPLHPNSALSQDWAMLSGTSMASPHIAGAMALVRQVHPDWTAAEVQSALEMTASQTVRRDVDPEFLPEGNPAAQHRAGAGRVDAKAAIDAGLVMDETVANFKLANPKAGGDVRQLNLPQLVDSNCRVGVCSWVRTVTATRDGNWTLSADTWVYDRWNNPSAGEINMHNAKMEFFPASFSLKAGESQTIVVKADIADILAQHNSELSGSGNTMDGLELWTNVNLTASDASIPKSHWPVSVNFDRMGLPEAVNLTVHRDNGGYRIADLPLAASKDVVYRAHGAVKADTAEVTLPQDNDHKPIYFDGDYEQGNNQISLIDVPEGSARLVVEVLDHLKGPGFNQYYGDLKGSLAIHIGRDFNGNGEADFDEEWLCSSTTQIELNYCSLTNPDAGSYWVMLSNTSTNMVDWTREEGPDPYGYNGVKVEDLVDSYKVATAVVPQGANGLEVTGPAVTTGAPVDIDLNWTLDELVEGDVAYAGVDIGSSVVPGNVGFIPLRLERGMDDVTVVVNDQARGGDVLDVKVHVVQNNTGADRDFNLSTVIPEGLLLVPDSVKVSTAEQQANLVVDGNTIRIAGVQQDSTNWMRNYNVTTSETDAMCQVPNYGRNGKGFVGLAENYGLVPELGGNAADWIGTGYYDENWNWVANNPFEIKLANFWGDEGKIHFFHNKDYATYDRFIVSPQGFVSFGPALSAGQHLLQQKFPYNMTPYGPFVAPFWRGQRDVNAPGWNTTVDALGTPLVRNGAEPWSGSGIAVAYSTDEVIIEWVNSRTQGMSVNWQGRVTPTGTEDTDRYTFDLIMNKAYRYGAGEFEIVMAYGDMDFADTEDFGSIGMHGNYGPLDIFGYPYGQETGISAAYNDLSDVTKRDMVICYDYTGPEATQFDLSFQVRVAETAAGQTLAMDLTSDVSGMGQKVIANVIDVAGNITLPGFNDVTVDENTSFDIQVVYADIDANPNNVSVTGEHISAMVNATEVGAQVTITPEANWHGETTVTVNVADSVNPTDAAVQSFALTVVSDGVELGCTDSGATNFDPAANKDNGSCAFPAAETPASSGSGSMGWFVLLLLPFIYTRRIFSVKK